MSGAAWVSVALGGAAVVWDLRTATIPNWLAAAGAGAGLACGFWTGGMGGLGLSAAGAAAGFTVFLLFHWLGGLGGGDVKLMAAFGALLGPAGVLEAAVLAAIAGGLLAAAVCLWRPRRASIPYAPAIVIGAWLALWGRS